MTEEKEVFQVYEEEGVPVKVEEQVVEPKFEKIEDDVIDLPKRAQQCVGKCMEEGISTHLYENGLILDTFLCSQVLRRLGSIFTLVYVAVQKLKKDSWKELQFSLVDSSK
nr:hypothetical protein [Tanacetum cinerariifolium]